ncbi:hypothetical protein ADL05_11045 [Nocardiopsis sp. NRRL B-16309]|nr:hypothetical protein ADL05_11045 [Nocardiopsis sp. NRRL B-16309]
MTRGRDDEEGSSFPWAGVLLSVLAVLAMLGVSVALWAELPTRASGDAAFGGDGSRPPRLLMAAAMPGVTAMIVGSMALGPLLGPALHRGMGLPRHWSGRSDRALMNAFLVLIAVFLLAAHTVLLHEEAGRALFLPLERLLVLFTSGLLVGLGLAVALRRTPTGNGHVVARWWDRARRPVGAAVVVVGAVVASVGSLLPEAVHAAPLVALLAPAMALGCAVPLVGDQSWRHGNRSGS